MDFETLAKQAGFANSEAMNDVITKLALAFANSARTSGLHPAFALDAATRFTSSLLFGISEASSEPNSLPLLVRMFKAALDQYIVSIEEDADTILTDPTLAPTEYVA